MPWAAWKTVAVRTWREASADNVGLVAAGVAFYGFLALVPLLTALVLSYGIFADPATVVDDVDALASVVPPNVAEIVRERLTALVAASDGSKGLGVAIALAVAIFGARNGAGAIVTALNIAYEEDEKRGFVRLNLTILAMTAAAVVAALLAIAVTTVLSVLSNLVEANPVTVVLGTMGSYALLTLVGAAGAAALYRYAPSRDAARWEWISPGSLFAALFWLLLTLGFGTYVANVSSFDESYGPLGAVMALLTWLYLSSYILLFGAELNSELEHQTRRDTTTGAPQPMGVRRAWVADHVAGAQDSGAAAIEPDIVDTLPLRAAAPAEHERRARGTFVAARVGARTARVAGLPKIGWLSSGLASLGLAMLRRRGRQTAGAVVLGTAVGLSLLRARERPE